MAREADSRPDVEAADDVDAEAGQQPEAVTLWQRAATRGDAASLGAALAADVRLLSPLTGRFDFRGAAEILELLTAAFEVIDDIRWETVLGDGSAWALFYSAQVGGICVQEAQLLRLDATGRIAEITLFLRPLPAQTALMARLGPRLARRQRRGTLAAFLAVATRPLHAMAAGGDRWIVPLAAPRLPNGRRRRRGTRLEE